MLQIMPNNRSVSELNVAEWLVSLGMGEHAAAFAQNGVDGGLLADLTNDDLKDLGVLRLVDRKRILAAIEQLGDDIAVAVPAASRTGDAVRGERRQVTVLFADISGFTRFSAELGAERTHALLDTYFRTVDEIVVSFGGTIDKHIGDSVMAVFGAPVAHDNDPERAARAALEIHAAMDATSEAAGHALKVHIGIASGQVVASGVGGDQHYTMTGDSVNLASRLTDAAGPMFQAIIELETESLSTWESRRREVYRQPEFRTWFTQLLTTVQSGTHDFYRVEHTGK